MAKSLYDFTVPNVSAKEVKLADYKGKVVLVVNTASQCGFTPQYKDLQEIQQKYEARGFTVLGFPSNDFGGQEPGSNAEIKKFCELKYKTTFPIFAKAPVSGGEIQPVFQWLTKDADPQQQGPVEWNFEKFVIDGDGHLVKRFKSKVKPTDAAVTSVIESTLAAKKS
jgi:glutathione peroxidase